LKRKIREMNNNDNKFSAGFLLGLLIGGGIVFLLGTRSGKNLLKIASEQGLDGLTNLLEEYDLGDLGEYEEVDSEEEADLTQEQSKEAAEGEQKEESDNHESKTPKKRFFKKIRR
jgi:gas vesicle protein